SSDTLMPARLARCIWISCSTSRSSTCWRSTFCAGSSSFCWRSRSPITWTWASSSLLSTTPSLTIAATRSSSSPRVASSRVCALACPGRARTATATQTVCIRAEESVRCMSIDIPTPDAAERPLFLERRRFGGCVAPDHLGERGVRRRSDTGEACEFQLQPDPGVLAGPGHVAAHVPAGTEPDPPAARTVLEPGETLQRLVIAQRVDLAGEQIPAAPDRPGAGRLDLLESGLDRVEQRYRALVAVGEVHHRVVGGLVLQVHLRTLAALGLGIPLYGGIRAPVTEGRQCQLRHEVGALVGGGDLARQRHARGHEVVGLADGGGEELPPVARIEQAARDTGAHLIGVAHAVGADITVGAEELDGIEVRQRRVEHRQLALIAVRHLEVQDPRLERQLAFGVRAAFALEQKARVEAGDRELARGRARLGGGGVIELIAGRAPGERGAHEVSGTGEIEGDGGPQVRPPAGDSDRPGGALEVDDLGVETVAHESGRSQPVVGAHRDARHARIGPLADRQRVVDGLKLLRFAVEPPVRAAVGERGAPLDERGAGALRAQREILEVEGVAHVLRVRREAQVVRELGDLGEPYAVAAAVEGAVVGKIVPVDLAALAVREEAQIAAEVRAGAAVLDGLEGEVRIRRDVPVVRDREL